MPSRKLGSLTTSKVCSVFFQFILQSKGIEAFVCGIVMTFRHLVLSGGSNAGLAFFGAIKELVRQEVLSLDALETIHATSVGTLLAVYLALKYDLQDIETFAVDRPWQEVYKVDFHTIVRAVQEGGMFDIHIMEQTLQPMLFGKDFTLDSTLQELYEFSGIELHFFTTEYASLTLVDLSHKTHPDWRICDAVYASSCLPILFDPFCKDGIYYIDGAVLKNYPLQNGLDEGYAPDEIMGIYYETHDSENENMKKFPFLSPSSSYKLIDYSLSFFVKVCDLLKLQPTEAEKQVPFQLFIQCDTSPIGVLETFTSRDRRKQLVQEGVVTAQQFLQKSL